LRAIDHPNSIFRPYVWIAVAAFATGFLGYLAIHPTF
jgi:hypothetical protein